MWSKYYTVTTIAEALELLAEYGTSARIIAGGTDILIELERLQRPEVKVLVDISRVERLREIVLRGDEFSLGALVTHNDVVGSSLLIERALPLAQACWEVGAPQIRNRATLAGNLITASPANDTITPLMALGAHVRLASKDGERSVPLAQFYTGLRRTLMRPDEMLTAVTFPALGGQERGIFLKLGLRRAQAISVVNVAVILGIEEEHIVQAAITLGSVAPTIMRVPVAEQALIGQQLSPSLIREVARLAAAAPSPIDDVRGTAAYRTEMVQVLVGRALRALAENTQAHDWPAVPAMLWGDHAAGSPLETMMLHTDHEPISFTLNGQPVSCATGQHKSLLRFLREDLGATGTKEGCAEGECGACTVFMDGAAVMACMIPAPRVHGTHVVTVEGLRSGDALHPIQQAFIDQGAVQCGYCTPGFLMAGAKLLEEFPEPTQAQIQQSISGNLCRCTGYYKIIQAFIEASKRQNAMQEA